LCAEVLDSEEVLALVNWCMAVRMMRPFVVRLALNIHVSVQLFLSTPLRTARGSGGTAGTVGTAGAPGTAGAAGTVGTAGAAPSLFISALNGGERSSSRFTSRSLYCGKDKADPRIGYEGPERE
jgi:hypothetical protein